MINQFQKQIPCVRKVSKSNVMTLTSIFRGKKTVISAPPVAPKGITVCLFDWGKTSLVNYAVILDYLISQTNARQE